MLHDGEAEDAVITDAGELVMVEEDAEVQVVEEGTVLAIVTQEATGELVVRVFGDPTKELIAALHTAMRELLTAMK
jgi:hypothetical protein